MKTSIQNWETGHQQSKENVPILHKNIPFSTKKGLRISNFAFDSANLFI